MAATVVSTVSLQIDSILTNLLGVASGQATLSRGLRTSLASGVGANQCDKVYSETKTALAGNYDLDLAGVLTDAFGAALTFARVKAILIVADAANTTNVLMGGIGATAFFGPFGSNADKVNTRPGGATLLFAPDATAWAVTAATADILRFAPSAGSVTFDIVVLGASA